MRRIRILVGGINHESNSFNPIITGEDDFTVYAGDEILVNLNPGYSITGIVNTLREADAEIVPVLLARAVPNGLVSAAFYNRFKTEFIDRAAEAKNRDAIGGICLALHGSMKTEDLLCAEEDLCISLRKMFPDIPITAALDMHASITPGLLKTVDGFAGYKTAPHTDEAQTGSLAASMLIDALETKNAISISTVCRQIPMLVAGEKSESSAEPMASLLKECRRHEKEPGIKAVSLLMGYPWADCEYNTVTVLVSFYESAAPAVPATSAGYSNGQGCSVRQMADIAIRQKADTIAKNLAAQVWKQRRDFTFSTETYKTRAALEACYVYAENGERPVFLSDSGDNPTAGATGDSTDLLEAILQTIDRADKLPAPMLYSGFYDEAAAAACARAGEGAEPEITLGGNRDTVNGKKIPLKVKVKKIVRGYGSYKSDLVLVSYRNLLITITSKHIGFGDPDLLPALGIDAADYCLVAVKLGYLEPCFTKIAARAVMALTKGCSNEALEIIPYKKVRRPVFPLDPETDWKPD
ncbi:MAG: M81 family metallopeptidase [Treponema sp.]|nr:M81 family metallopeptidase [Treponema sp.]